MKKWGNNGVKIDNLSRNSEVTAYFARVRDH